jgi:hypothetical protein
MAGANPVARIIYTDAPLIGLASTYTLVSKGSAVSRMKSAALVMAEFVER